MLSKIESIAKFLEPKMPFTPKAGIILGTGLGGLIQKIDIKLSLSYQDIPDFPVSTVEGHSGKLIFGLLSGVPSPYLKELDNEKYRIYLRGLQKAIEIYTDENIPLMVEMETKQQEYGDADCEPDVTRL